MTPANSPILELLVGNIASGKSSWTLPRAAAGWITVNHDSLVRSMHGGNYDWENQVPGLKTELGVLIIGAAGAAGRSVVIDNTNRGLACRRPYVEAARRAGMRVRAVLFPKTSPETHARRRFESDARGMCYNYWLEVACLVERQWEPPGDEEVDERVSLPENWLELVITQKDCGAPVDLDGLFTDQGASRCGDSSPALSRPSR